MPQTINARVAPTMLDKVTRLFNGTLSDILMELLQNARRAGATSVHIDGSHDPHHDTCTAMLRVDDDGCGIADPAVVLTLGSSNWDRRTLASEDPAGMGVFSLAGRNACISSRTAGGGLGWRVTVPADAWTSGAPLAVEGCVRRPGTTISVEIPHDWLVDIASTTQILAAYYPLPIIVDGNAILRSDFLDGAIHTETFEGVRIGVFHDLIRSHQRSTINFHGVTVYRQLPKITEVGRARAWHARVDVVDCPALQLTLPARKEVVDTPFLPRLAVAVETAIYRAIAAANDHRLGHDEWTRAAALGVVLAEAKTGLDPFIPKTADPAIGQEFVPSQIDEENVVIIDGDDPAVEQTLGRALLLAAPGVAPRLVRAVPAFAGYPWYDALARVRAVEFEVVHGNQGIVVGPGLTTSHDPNIPVVDAITAIVLVAAGDKLTEYRWPTDALLEPHDEWDLDNAPIAVVTGQSFGYEGRAGDPMSPAVLADLIDGSYFVSSDDRDAGSFDSQLTSWRDDSEARAISMLQGRDAATHASIAIATRRHLAWMVPAGHRLVVTVQGNDVDIVLAPVGEAADTTAC